MIATSKDGGVEARALALALPSRLPGLDGLRAVAIGLVILSHVRAAPGFPGGTWLQSFAAGGAYGVVLFFTLSGFLITHLLLREEEESGAFSLRRFYARRALRILPPAFAYLAAAAAYAHGLGQPLADLDLAGCALFFRNLVDGPRLTDQYWSLGIEEQFYLLFPLLLLVLPKRIRVPAFLAGCGWAPAWRWINVSYLGPVNWWRADLRYDALLAGALLALILHSPKLRARWTLLSRHGPLLAPAAMLFLTVTNVVSTPVPGWLVTAVVSAQLAINALLIGVLVEGKAGPIGRALELRWIRWVGAISYSLYLWQQPFCWNNAGKPWEAFPLNVLLSVAAAWLSYRLVERPALELRRRWLDLPHAQVASIPVPAIANATGTSTGTEHTDSLAEPLRRAR